MASDLRVSDGDDEVERRLSRELTAFNTVRSGRDDQRALTVSGHDEAGLRGALHGWTWGTAAGVELLWVREDQRSSGLGAALLATAEGEARRRGCVQVTLSSFTFQAPGFYQRQGYVEFARTPGIPTVDHADVHLRKLL